MTATTKPNATARALRTLEILATCYFDGLGTNELATRLGTNATNACRAAQALEEIGWARKLENGRWGMTVKPLAIMQAYSNQAQQIQARMAETTSRIAAGAAQYTQERI